MSKFKAEQIKKYYNEEDNSLVVQLIVKGYDKKGAQMAYEEQRKHGKPLNVEITQFRSKRSLEQNKLLWVLLGKMATAMSGKAVKRDSEYCYCLMLEECNCAFEYILALPEAEEELRKSFRVLRFVATRDVDTKIDEETGEIVETKTLNMYQCFKGSSKYDVAEMTELIETTLDRLAELGVTDSEIEHARKEYM